MTTGATTPVPTGQTPTGQTPIGQTPISPGGAAPGAVAETPAARDTGLGQPVVASADPIDRVVRLAPKWTIFVLAGCALLVVGALIWAFAGEITSVVRAPGILKDNGYVGLSASQPGEVTSVPVRTGQAVVKGQTLMELSSGNTITAPSDATVAAIYVAPGSNVSPEEVAVAITDTAVPDVVYTLLPSASVGSVTAGMAVEMDLPSAPSSTYGYLKGTVLEVSNMPLTTQEVATRLGIAPEIVAQALGTQPGLLAVVGITPDPGTPSQYAWTVGDGPPFALSQGASATAKVILSREKPIEVVFPNAGDTQP